MNFLKTLAKFSVGTWIQAALGLITTPIIAWFITPEEFGKASMFTLAFSLSLNIALLAIDQGYARFYNESSDKGSILRASLLPIVFTCSLSLALIELGKHIISPFLFDTPGGKDVHLLSIALIIGVLLRISTMTLRMQGSASRFSFIQVIQAIFNFCFVVLYAKFVAPNFKAILVGLILSQFVGLIFGIAFNYKLWMTLFKRAPINKKLIGQILLYSLPFVPTFLLDWLFQGVDRTFLRSYSDFTQIGLYATASKIAFSLNVIQTGFTSFWFPYSLERYKNHPDDTTVYKTIFNALVFTFGTLILLIILFQDVVLMILPKSYYGVLPIFPILLFIPMLYTLSEVTVVGINYKRKTFQHLYIISSSLVSNGVIAFFLVKPYGALGAAISMLGGYIVFFCCRSYFGRKNYHIDLDIKKLFISLGVIALAVLLAVISSPFFYVVGILGIVLLVLMYKKDLLDIKKI